MSTVRLVATGNPVTDRANIRNAIIASSSGDTIELQNADSGPGAAGFGMTRNGFAIGDFLPSLNKSLTLQGVPNAAGVKAAINGGGDGANFAVLLVASATIDFQMYDIDFNNFVTCGLFVTLVRNITVQRVGCKTTGALGVTTTEHFNTGPGGTGKFCHGILVFGSRGGNDAVLGNGLFDSNEVDLLTDGVQPSNSDLFTCGIQVDMSAASANVVVTNNKVRGTSFIGISHHDGHGSHQGSNNSVQMTSWAPLTAQGNYFNGPTFASGFAYQVDENEFRPLGTDGGSYFLDMNELHCEQPGGLALLMSNGRTTATRPIRVSATHNECFMNPDPANPAFSGIFNKGCSGAYIGQNKFHGQGLFGSVIGSTDGTETDDCAYVANQFNDYVSQSVEMVFEPNTNGNVVVGNGKNSGSVFFATGQGTNKITGYAPVSGGVGQTIQDAASLGPVTFAPSSFTDPDSSTLLVD